MLESSASLRDPDAAPPAETAHILVVESDERYRELLAELLRGAGYACVTSSDAVDARNLLVSHSFRAVISDVQLPNGEGTDILELAGQYPGTASVMLSSTDDRELVDHAVSLGIDAYITKPFKRNEVLVGIAGALRRRVLEIENSRFRARIGASGEERAAELGQTLDRLKGAADKVANSHEQTILRLSQAIEYHDGETEGHVERVGCYTKLLTGFTDVPPDVVRVASFMHDVGKIAVGASILQKPGQLTSTERQGMERHCEIGYQLLSGSDSELLELAATIALTHHERFDGTGYPQALQGEDIPVEGRIVAVADVFDALTSDRAYRPAFSVEEALAILREGRGTQFDPEVLDRFLACLDEVQSIRAELAD
ncbi:MAG: HD domain-containing phosphohydrolase [Thermoleophilaceae bacterium]